MDFSEVLNKLNDVEGGAEMIEALKSHDKARRDENQSVRSRMKDFESKLDVIADKLQTPKENVVEKVSEDKLSVKALNEKLINMEKREAEAIKKADAADLTSAIKTKLGDSNVKSSLVNDMTDLLKGRYSKVESGDFVTSEGVSVTDDIEQYLEGKDDFISNPVEPGADIKTANGQAPKATERSNTGNKLVDQKNNISRLNDKLRDRGKI